MNWSAFNAGLTSAAAADYRSAGPDSMVVIGNDVFMSTTDGKIWKYTTSPITFSATQQLGGLNILAGDTVLVNGGGIGHRSMLYTPSVSIAGTLDLTTDDLDVQSSASLPAVFSLIQQGFNGGNWNGKGISSSAAANDTRHGTALGVMQNVVTGGSPVYMTFDGAAVAGNNVLVKYTYYGDANLDGAVNGADYQQIDHGLGSHLTGWWNGDFNYDGVVDGSDFALIDNSFNQIAATGAGALALMAEPTNLSTVPEPAVIGLLGFVAVSSLGRRRNRATDTTHANKKRRGDGWPGGEASTPATRRDAYCSKSDV